MVTPRVLLVVSLLWSQVQKKRNKNAQVKCEKYDCDTNKWSTMQDLNIGRFYHASCAFSG